MAEVKIPRPNITSLISKLKVINSIPSPISALLAALILGPVGAIVATYLQTMNIEYSIDRTTVLFCSIKLPPIQSLSFLSVLTCLFFYLHYMTGFMRRRITSSEKNFNPLLIEGNEKFQESFKLSTDFKIPIVLGLVLMVLYTFQPLAFRNFQTYCMSPVCILYVAIAYPFWFVAFMIFIWTYFTSIKGLFDLGRNRIRLKSFRENKMLGVRPFGTLSLSFSYTYFFSLALIILAALTLSPNTPTLLYLSFITVLIILGIIFFIIPLYTIHIKMIQYKKQEQESFQAEIGKVIGISSNIKDRQNNDAIFEIRDALSNLTNIMTIDVTKKEIESIPTWPLDASIMGKLMGIILTVVATLLGNYIMRFLLHWF